LSALNLLPYYTQNVQKESKGEPVNELRRHQRIRFNTPPAVRIGQYGWAGRGVLESLALGGLMLRSEFPLRIGEAFGCELEVFASPLIDLSAQVVSRVGDRYSARFQAGPLSACLIQEAIDRGLAAGEASILSVNEVRGRKMMRIAGGFNGGLRDDFMHALTRTGVDWIDLSAVTIIDDEGSELCRIAVEEHQVGIVRPSPCVCAALKLDPGDPIFDALEFDNDRPHET
jgi:hypothetical protein